jgi:hypothetical protein
MHRMKSLLWAASAAIPLLAGSVWAQSAQPEVAQQPAPAVGDRSQPEFDPLGIRVSSFLFFPKVELSEYYDDNIYRQDNNTESDFITTLAPSFRLASDWNVHSLVLDAGLTQGWYADNSDNDYTDYTVGAAGRIDVLRELIANINTRHQQLHENRGSVDAPTATREPVEYTRTSVGGDVRWKPNRLGITLGGDYAHLNFDDTTNLNGSTSNNDDRDRDQTEGRVRLGYEFQENYEAFVLAAVNNRSYDDSIDDNGFRRDSDGYRLEGGVAFDLTRLIRAEVGAGYLSQSYDDARLSDVSGFSMNGSLEWYITQLTTIRALVARTVTETTLSGASGALSTRFGVGIDHELLRNVILRGDFNWTQNDYEGINRTDDIYSAEAAATYRLNRNIYTQAQYTYETRKSDATNADFSDNLIMLRLGGQF